MDIQNILSIISAVLGGTNIYAFWLLWKTRKSDIKKTEASALDSIDAIYVKMSASTDKKLDEMQKTIDNQSIEIKELTKSVQDYAKKCANCKINQS